MEGTAMLKAPTEWTKELTDKMVHLRKNTSMSVREIAEQLGLNKNAVSGKLNRLGLTKPEDSPIVRTGFKPKPKAKRVVELPPLGVITSVSDGCASIDDDGVRCERLTQRGSSYCPHHHALYHLKKGRDNG
jgi:transposase-like protein